MSVDFFTVPTIRFQMLYVSLVLAHDRCRILHVGVTGNPHVGMDGPATARSLPIGMAPPICCVTGTASLATRVCRSGHGVTDVRGACRHPARPGSVRTLNVVIGTIWRECLEHVIVAIQRSLRRHLNAFVAYHHQAERTSVGEGRPRAATSAVLADMHAVNQQPNCFVSFSSFQNARS